MKAKICVVLAIAGLALAQDSSQQKSAPPPPPPQPQNSAPAPLFGGQLGIHSSQNTKESASLGFNGIDPSGKVDQKMLATTATAADQAKVQQLSDNRPQPAELDAFLLEGGLNKK
jgi:hypothetical protein